MARHIGLALAALMVAGSAAVASDLGRAQAEPSKQQKQEQQKPDGHQRRGWWHDKRIAAELALTSDQVDRLEHIFGKYTEKAVPLRKELEDLEKALDQAVRTQKLDVATFAQEVDRIENRRAELNKMRAVMLYRLRLVLNTEQHNKFQAMRDRRDSDRRKDNDRRH
jgi:Spy/CpxP family protein refolding chaperone